MPVSGINTVTTPDFSQVINQEFFIESLGGPKPPHTYLENFPEEIYTHSIDSNLATLLYTLIGPAGVGWVKQNHLLARLSVEEAGLQTVDLDSFYANPFSFARLISESYESIPTSLLSTEQWERIKALDASYRNRAIDFLKAVRAGGTLEGLTLAAKSGLNRPVAVIENYKALYDHFSDDPLGLPFYGATQSTEEVIVLPRQNVPTSSVQTIAFTNKPNKGKFTIQVPLGSEANSKTAELSYGIHFNELQKVLEELPAVGERNVLVQGGPLAEAPFKISFTRELADHVIPELIVKSIGMENTVSKELSLPVVEVNQAGIEADGEESAISARDWHYVISATNGISYGVGPVSSIKPVTTVVTPGKAPGITKRVITNLSYTDSTATKVVRYVTGLATVKWPTTDSTHWIQGSKEIEAPIPQHYQSNHYNNFHNIKTAIAYSDKALEDPAYETSLWPETASKYLNEKVGPFSKYETLLYPTLKNTDPTFRYLPTYAIADPPSPLTIQAITEGTESVRLIEGIYPTDYQSLPGIKETPKETFYWSSLEELNGTDYLEVDLGSVQMVNFICFQATTKPYTISIDYDKLDLAPARSFVPVTFLPSEMKNNVTQLAFQAGRANAWRSCQFTFTNSLGQPIYTRFIRLGFKRNPGAPFVQGSGSIPFSVQVSNLRIGRNVSSC